MVPRYYFSDKRSENGWALITIDDGEGELVSTFLESWDNRWFSQALCWSKTDLGNGPHTIKITHSDHAGKYVSLDFFKYTPHSGGKRSPSLIAIVAGSVGGGLLLVISGIVLYLIHRRLSSTDTPQTELGDAKEEAGILRTAELQSPSLPYASEQVTSDNQVMVHQRLRSEKTRSGLSVYTGLPEPQTA
ncbi:unnamed protein product [Rhizoctonia solani]|uniref:Uncharacterized protein n=1 Tax=Rhizoctonia solani TaxID=456999 RepID=A0A8H3EDS4_9AGAM|nr:unnamed protein product [Rhizoctonia solani]